MKKIIIILVLLLAFVVLGIFIYKQLTADNKEPVYVTHTMVVRHIEGLGNLEVVKYTIQDLMDYKKVRRWLPDSKTSLKVVGEVIACVDLTKIRSEDIFTMEDSVSIILPVPEVCHYKVDHSQSRVYNVEHGFWETTHLVDEAYAEAEQHLYQQALKMGIAHESRENAIQVIVPVLRALGFEKIYIGFRSPYHTMEHESGRTIRIEK